MNNGVERKGAQASEPSRAWARDALGAIALAEGAVVTRALSTTDAELTLSRTNAFGDELERPSAENGDRGDAGAMLRRLEEAAAQGERLSFVATARALAGARGAMRAIAMKRLGVVVHALCDTQAGGLAEALALGDLGWGVLFASSVGESLDLALIARRAAEDSGNPFIVVHERSRVRHTEPLVAPSRELCEVFIGPASARLRRIADPAHPIHAGLGERAFAERVPFALGSAMRELESLTGRRHDVLEREPAQDASLMLVGLGALGDSFLGEIERIRAAGHDVGAVKLVALRPFPGPRMVKALSRALVVSVIEHVDVPLAQSNPVTIELKAAFADALTWAPEYPGIGRIPRVVSGVSGIGGHELEASDVDAIVHNMLADDRGTRTFVLGTADLGPPPAVPPAPAGTFSVRGRAKDEETALACADLCAGVIASALGLRTRAAVRQLAPREGGGYAFDLTAGRERPRGGHSPRSVKLIMVDDGAALVEANPFARLAHAGVVAIPSERESADGLWNDVPAYVKAIVFDRGARLVGFRSPAGHKGTADEMRWLLASTYAGLALALASDWTGGRAPVDGSLVAREVKDALRAARAHASAGGADSAGTDALVEAGGDFARRAFEGSVEVPRAIVERDEEAIRLGRKDIRATSPPQ